MAGLGVEPVKVRDSRFGSALTLSRGVRADSSLFSLARPRRTRGRCSATRCRSRISRSGWRSRRWSPSRTTCASRACASLCVYSSPLSGPRSPPACTDCCSPLMHCAQGVESSVSRALDVVTRDESGILKDVPPANQAAAKAALAGLKKSLQQFKVVVDNKDKQEVRAPRLRACGGACASVSPAARVAGALQAAGGAGLHHAGGGGHGGGCVCCVERCLAGPIHSPSPHLAMQASRLPSLRRMTPYLP